MDDTWKNIASTNVPFKVAAIKREKTSYSTNTSTTSGLGRLETIRIQAIGSISSTQNVW